VVNDSEDTGGRDVRAVAAELRPIVMRLGRELRREARALGITGGQVTLLFLVKGSPGLGVRELAARERISPAAMSGVVRRLERAGLVERAPHPTDRRRHGLTVTAAGDRVLRSVKTRRTAWLADRLRRLEPEDVAAIERALEPLDRLLEAGD
jgi:DNA-binding MarR family transcriptional regulator